MVAVLNPVADVKATALLKLIYLEMVGHDMSWASFHVLEVMSSPKYHQKRVGYLGAVQSFRPDTEVLMLATNLLKKVLLTLQHYGDLLLMAGLGSRVNHTYSNFSSDRYSAARHYTLSRVVDSPGPHT